MDFDRRKKIIVVIVMMAVMSAVVQSYAATGGEMVRFRLFEKVFCSIKSMFAEENYEGIIRFHVKANSNSEEDQALKLLVRDVVLDEINAILEDETVKRYDAGKAEKHGETLDSGGTDSIKLTLSETREIILDSIDDIEAAASSIIIAKGYDYDVSAELGTTFIPQKTYGDVTFPAGNYEALTVTIGEGKGDNWWCVLFPPLCIIDPSGSSLAGAEFEELEKDAAFGNETKGVVLKFKTLEMLEKSAKHGNSAKN